MVALALMFKGIDYHNGGHRSVSSGLSGTFTSITENKAFSLKHLCYVLEVRHSWVPGLERCRYMTVFFFFLLSIMRRQFKTGLHRFAFLSILVWFAPNLLPPSGERNLGCKIQNLGSNFMAIFKNLRIKKK